MRRTKKAAVGLALTMVIAYLLYAKVITNEQIDQVKAKGGDIYAFIAEKLKSVRGEVKNNVEVMNKHVGLTDHEYNDL